jgi:DNA-binding transcriptional regulator YdaS (Cro superfamily)
MQRNAALTEAIERAGGLQALGRMLGISKQAIDQWRRVPAERVLEVERLTGISRYQLRPDVFGKR